MEKSVKNVLNLFFSFCKKLEKFNGYAGDEKVHLFG